MRARSTLTFITKRWAGDSVSGISRFQETDPTSLNGYLTLIRLEQPLPLTPDERRRLAFIRGLYRQAQQISETGGPMMATALLLIHDATELFLVLVVEHLNIPAKTGITFMQYWDLVPQLTHKKSMDRLNTARGSLKHKGVSPADTVVRELVSIAHSFLIDSSHVFLGVNFDAISMVDAIANAQVRDLLAAAETELEQKKPTEAITQAAQAAYLANTPLSRRLIESRPSAFDPEGDRWAREAIVELAENITLVTLGVNQALYARFRRISPSVVRSMAGSWQVRWRGGQEASTDDARFAIDFVTDFALAAERVFGE